MRKYFTICLYMLSLFLVLGESKGQTCSSCREQEYDYSFQWGTSGSGTGQFNGPYGIAVHGSYVYVVDQGNNRVQKFSISGTTATYVTSWGGYGTGNGQFNTPWGITVDNWGDVYVVDGANGRIQKFDASGTFIVKWGSAGSGNGQFSSPRGIVSDLEGSVYVVDQGNNRVQKFDVSGTSVTYVSKFGTYGSGNGQLNGPTFIAFDSNELEIYVTDSGNNRVQAFGTSDGINYYYAFQWSTYGSGGASGSGRAQFNNPQGIVFDLSSVSSKAYVVDSGNHRVQKMDQFITGNIGSKYITQFGSSGSGNGQFNTAKGIAIDGSCNIYVADQGNNRIEVFSPATTSTTPTPTVTSFSPSSGVVGSTVTVTGTGFSNTTSVAFGFGDVPVEYVINSSTQLTVTVPVGAYTNKIIVYGLSCAGGSSSTDFTVLPGGCASCTGQGYDYTNQWGSSGTGNYQFGQPWDIATDNSGNVYVVDQTHNRVKRYSVSGTTVTYLNDIGTGYGSGNGQMNLPWGVTVDQNGNVFVVDGGNSRIQKFSVTGTFMGKFGSYGSGNGQFLSARGIAVDNLGYVYVVDQNNQRVQKFDNNGTFITRWGSPGGIVAGGNGEFAYPVDIAVDASGIVYVTDAGNDRVQVFDNTGLYQGQFGTSGSGNGQLNSPKGVAVDLSGNIYVGDTGNNRVQKFDGYGNYLTQFGSYGTGNGQFNPPAGIAIDASCNLFVSDLYNDRVEQFNPGITLTSFSPTSGLVGASVTITGTGFLSATAVAFNGTAASFTINSATQITAIVPSGATTGTITITNTACSEMATSASNYTVLSCNGHTYTYTSQFGTSGSSNGQLATPYDLAIDGAGNIYVGDTFNNRVQKFTSGSYSSQFGSFGTGNGKFDGVTAVAIDPGTGNIFVSDKGNYRVQVFSSSGVYQSKIGSSGSGNGQFNGPFDIALASGYVYVVDAFNYRIQKFSLSGTTLTYYSQWGNSGSGNGLFNSSKGPQSIAIDAAGYIYVTDPGNSRVQKFDNTGTYQSQFGTNGTGNGQFSAQNMWIAIDGSGNIYVSEGSSPGAGNNRIQKFDATGTYVTQFGSYGSGNGQLSYTQGLLVDPFCNVYVADAGNNRIEEFALTQGSRLGEDSDISEAENTSVSSAIQVYPNPSKGEFSVTASGKNNFDVFLYNALGELVLKDQANGDNYTVSNATLANGIYILHVVSNGEMNKTKLIISK